MYTTPPCDYKRRRWACIFWTSATTVTHTLDHHHTLSTTEHSPQPTPLLAETWELPSLSRLACTSYYNHSGCKIIQCPRTPLCWMYGPAAGTRINPCVTVLPLASTSGTRKHAALLVGSGPPGQDIDRICFPSPRSGERISPLIKLVKG